MVYEYYILVIAMHILLRHVYPSGVCLGRSPRSSQSKVVQAFISNDLPVVIPPEPLVSMQIESPDECRTMIVPRSSCI